MWNVSQALTWPFGCFLLSLHCFFRIDIRNRCSICTALQQVLYAEVIPLTFWDCCQDFPVEHHACPTLPGICVWRTPRLRGPAKPLCSHGMVSYVKMLVMWNIFEVATISWHFQPKSTPFSITELDPGFKRIQRMLTTSGATEDGILHQKNLQRTLLLNILDLTLFPPPFNTQLWTQEKLE